MISIIIPTYNEAENIKKLIPEIFKTLTTHKLTGETIIVDDSSPDGTGEVAEELKTKFPMQVIHRHGKQGLSSAVLDGFKIARGDILGVMDADLSHPAAKIPIMAKMLNSYDIVIGSRYIKGGDEVGWSRKRKIISKGAILLSRPLTRVKDSMSGFFMLKRSVIKKIKLNPKGFKIGLEILVKCNTKSVKEIPYIFVNRKIGESKLNLFEIFNYLKHISSLYLYRIKSNIIRRKY